MTNPSNRLTRIRAGGPIGPADAEWLLGEVERLQMRLKRHEPVSLYNGHDIDWWKAEAERLRGNLSLAEEGLANYALEVERLQSNQREHIQEITELTQNRDDYKADYLRMHKMFMDLKYPDTVPAHEPCERHRWKPGMWNVYYVRSDGQERPALSAETAEGAANALRQDAADLVRVIESEGASRDASSEPKCGLCGKPGITEFVRTCCAEGRARDLATARTAKRTSDGL